jgi:hypothetical protein
MPGSDMKQEDYADEDGSSAKETNSFSVKVLAMFKFLVGRVIKMPVINRLEPRRLNCTEDIDIWA